MRWRRRRAGVVCQQFVELVTDYLEGALPPGRHDVVERHLAACGDCRAYLLQMRRTLSVAGKLGPEDVPDEVVNALMRALDEF
jgi:anti-sigma factor RsiW